MLTHATTRGVGKNGLIFFFKISRANLGGWGHLAKLVKSKLFDIFNTSLSVSIIDQLLLAGTLGRVL